MPSVSQPTSSPASSSLLSLHKDILLEILAHLLLDTARAPHKTAILQTCTLLHELGLPLLYKVVDLGGLLTRSRIVDCWTDLFGKGGLLTQDGRIQDLRRNVVKLRIGGPKNQGATNALEGRVFEPANLPRCKSLILERAFYPFFSRPSIMAFTAHLPLQDFTYDGALNLKIPSVTHAFDSALGSRFGRSGEQPWKDLHTIHMRGALSYDHQDEDRVPFVPRVSFWDWSFKVLALDLADKDEDWMVRPGASRFFNLFLHPVGAEESSDWWRGLERIELRGPPELEAGFRIRLDEARSTRPFAGLQKRILPMVVFIERDGTERRLIEENE